MPLSAEAITGLGDVVEWNPEGAHALLAILKEYPEWVKYKDDPYGPLGVILFGVMPSKRIGNGVSIPVKTNPFPKERLTNSKTLGDEWKQRRFTKQELADAIEKELSEIAAV